jgi:hypothetical protein
VQPPGTRIAAAGESRTRNIAFTFGFVASSGSASGGVLKLATTEWYEPHLGLLRAEITSGTLNGSQSVSLSGRLELIKLKLGE